MTLTEEQREAIRAVSDLPRAIGCTRCHNYIQKNYSNQFAVLRSMIDSSDHIVEPDELIGFDLERARGLRDFLQDDCAEVGDVWGEMIAEIERLRAENEDLSKAVIDIQEERDLAQAEFRSYHRAWEEQAARVQELEEVLVEMVATNPCNIPTLCDVVHDELMCPALDGNCDFWKGCPQKNELREAARKQLQAEGKIGPDARPKCDHAWQAAIEERGYQTCLKCGECRNIEDIPRTAPAWQITEERKAAIKELSELLTAIGCPSCHYYIQKNYGENITVLRAMLTEAGQE